MTIAELIEELNNCPCGTAGHCMSCATMAYIASDCYPTLFRPLYDGMEIVDYVTWKEAG